MNRENKNWVSRYSLWSVSRTKDYSPFPRVHPPFSPEAIHSFRPLFSFILCPFFSLENFFFWATVRASLFQILCSQSSTQRTPQDYYAKPKKNDSSVLYTPAIFFAFIFTSFF